MGRTDWTAGQVLDWREAIATGELHDGGLRNIRLAYDGSSLGFQVLSPDNWARHSDGLPSLKYVARFHEVPYFASRLEPGALDDLKGTPGLSTRDPLRRGQRMIWRDAEEAEDLCVPGMWPVHSGFARLRVRCHADWVLEAIFREGCFTKVAYQPSPGRFY